MFSVIFIPEYCRVWKLFHGDCISMMCFQTNDLFMNSHYIPPEGSKNAAFPVFPWNRKNKINFSLKLAMESKSVLACSNTIFKNIITLSDTDLSHKLVNSNRLIKHMLHQRLLAIDQITLERPIFDSAPLMKALMTLFLYFYIAIFICQKKVFF